MCLSRADRPGCSADEIALHAERHPALRVTRYLGTVVLPKQADFESGRGSKCDAGAGVEPEMVRCAVRRVAKDPARVRMTQPDVECEPGHNRTTLGERPANRIPASRPSVQRLVTSVWSLSSVDAPTDANTEPEIHSGVADI